MNILKKLTYAIGIFFSCSLVILWPAMLTAKMAEQAQEQIIYDLEAKILQADIDALVLAEAAKRDKESKVLARAFYSEYRSGTAADRAEEWDKMFSGIYNRVEYMGWWEDELLETLQFGCETLCEINGLPLVGEEALLTEIGQEAFAFAQQMVQFFHEGPFEPSHKGHSWATPTAAAVDPWFQTLCLEATGPGHEYYGDCPQIAGPKMSASQLANAVDNHNAVTKKDHVFLALLEANQK